MALRICTRTANGLSGKSCRQQILLEDIQHSLLRSALSACTLHCRSLYRQQPSDFVRERTEDEKRSRSSRMRLFARNPLQISVIIDGLQAATARKSMQMATKLPSQQTHRVIHSARVLSCSFFPLLCRQYWTFHPTEGLPREVRCKAVARGH